MVLIRNLPTTENIAFFREEMAAHANDRLELEAAKDPNTASGIAAKLMLSERRARADQERHAELLNELRKPQWKTPNFWASVVAAVTGCIAIYPVLWPAPSLQQSAATAIPVQPQAASPSQQSSNAASVPIAKSLSAKSKLQEPSLKAP